MVTRSGGIWLSVLCVLGCGGKAAISETHASESGGQSAAGTSSVSGGGSTSGGATGGGSTSGGATSGGSPSTAGGSSGGMPSPQAGASGAAVAGTSGATDPSCYAVDPSCVVPDAYVTIYDDPPVTLKYAFDLSCDQCSPACSDCRAQPCGLWAHGVSGCGLDLELSACSEPGGRGVCLDTTRSDAHYTDPAGQRWPMPQLVGDSNQIGGEQANGAVDLNLDLSLPDGSGATRYLPVSVHLCALIVATGAVCK